MLCGQLVRFQSLSAIWKRVGDGSREKQETRLMEAVQGAGRGGGGEGCPGERRGWLARRGRREKRGRSGMLLEAAA